jgi:hypothetical protein
MLPAALRTPPRIGDGVDDDESLRRDAALTGVEEARGHGGPRSGTTSASATDFAELIGRAMSFGVGARLPW